MIIYSVHTFYSNQGGRLGKSLPSSAGSPPRRVRTAQQIERVDGSTPPAHFWHLRSLWAGRRVQLRAAARANIFDRRERAYIFARTRTGRLDLHLGHQAVRTYRYLSLFFSHIAQSLVVATSLFSITIIGYRTYSALQVIVFAVGIDVVCTKEIQYFWFCLVSVTLTCFLAARDDQQVWSLTASWQ